MSRKVTITWIVRYVDDRGFLQVRTFYTEEAALLFMAGQDDVRSWAEVRTTERPLPG